MSFAAIAAAAAAALSAGANLWSQDDTNKQNKSIARQQMAFQERMSNTSHQREAEDLRAAGMNPIMTATGGSGASTPSGASANMISPMRDVNFDPMTIMAVEKANADISKTKAETVVAESTALNLSEQNKNLAAQNVLLHRQAEKLLVDMGMTKMQARKVLAETNTLNYDLDGKIRGGIHRDDYPLIKSLKSVMRMVRDGEVTHRDQFYPSSRLPEELRY